MIRLTRVRSEAAIPSKYTEPQRRRWLTELRQARSARKGKLVEDYWHDAKPQLSREARGKCAYCECSALAVSFGDVEHFRPKSTYWWLAYCWENWLFSCQICNELYKGDAFPIGGRRMPTPRGRGGELAPDPMIEKSWTAFRRCSASERALLVNPYEEDPESLFGWRVDEALGEVELVATDDLHWSGLPRLAASRGVTSACDRVAAVIALLGLNREELRRRRFRVYQELALLLKVAQRVEGKLGEEAKAEVARMSADDAEFAGMVRQFVRAAASLSPRRRELHPIEHRQRRTG